MSLIHDRIRRRRAERIKNIMSIGQSVLDERQTIVPEQSPLEKEILQEKEKNNPISKWDDPEYVWKMAGNRAWQSADSGFSDAPKKGPRFRRLKVATIVSLCLFTFVWLLFQLSFPWAIKSQQWVQGVMTTELDYMKVTKWYEKVFAGSPSFLPSFFSKDKENPSKPAQKMSDKRFVPASGEVVAAFGTSSAPGIWLQGGALEPVHALSSGWVIYAAESEEQGYTVIIQHAEGLQSVYSNLSNVKLRKNDWVEGGEQIGRFRMRSEHGNYQLFFAIKKDEQYIDPLDVVSFD